MFRHTGAHSSEPRELLKPCFLAFVAVFTVMLALGGVIAHSREVADNYRSEITAADKVQPLMKDSKAYRALGKDLIEAVKGSVG